MTTPAVLAGQSIPVTLPASAASTPAAVASKPLSTAPAEIASSRGTATTVASVLLPEYCTAVQPQTGFTVVLCEPPLEGFWAKALPTLPALTTSILALLLSGYAIRYNFSKDARARRQSVQDDFWLRKVVSPVSVEPFVKFTGELLVNLPGADTSKENCEAFSHDRLAEFRALTVAFQALELLSNDLHKKVESELEAIEDRLAKYLGDLDAFVKGDLTSAPGRPEAIADLSALRLRVLEPIKEHQASLGL